MRGAGVRGYSTIQRLMLNRYQRQPSRALFRCPSCWRWLPECADKAPPGEPICGCPAEPLDTATEPQAQSAHVSNAATKGTEQ